MAYVPVSVDLVKPGKEENKNSHPVDSNPMNFELNKAIIRDYLI